MQFEMEMRESGREGQGEREEEREKDTEGNGGTRREGGRREKAHTSNHGVESMLKSYDADKTKINANVK
jgi:hypothetical protein